MGGDAPIFEAGAIMAGGDPENPDDQWDVDDQADNEDLLTDEEGEGPFPEDDMYDEEGEEIMDDEEG
jgi:E3 ubiquitin-protein ligase HUWE1